MANYKGKRVAPASWAAMLLLGAAVALALAAVVIVYQKYWDKTAPPPDASQDTSIQPAGSVSSGAAPEVSHSPEAAPYDFSQPAPEGEAVDNSYFVDAAFVGDSRTDGLMLYSGIGTGENLTSNGLSVFSLAEKKALTIGEEKYTLLEALALKRYGKVYLSLGVNELGYSSKNDSSFYRHYCEAIDAIRRVQPQAVIYVQTLIPVNEKQIEEYNGNKYNLTNDRLRAYNDLIRQAAEEKQVVCLDLYSLFVDENGSLPEEDSRDGVHLKKGPCQRWLDYLKTHTVEFDALYPDGPPVPEPLEPDEPVQPEGSAADGSVQG